jgi:ankyrin repeat domain-containing protein 50
MLLKWPQGASAGGHEKVVLMLLDAGADIKAKGGWYDNALQAASVGGHEKVAQMLLDAGANIKA